MDALKMVRAGLGVNFLSRSQMNANLSIRAVEKGRKKVRAGRWNVSVHWRKV